MLWRSLVILILAVFFLSSCSLSSRASLEIVCSSLAVVYLDGRNVGTTPFKNSYLSPGPHSLRLVNHDSKEFSRDLELKNNISTVVNWDFFSSDSVRAIF